MSATTSGGVFDITSVAVISVFVTAKVYLFCQIQKYFAKKDINWLFFIMMGVF